jgi:hypothetical protein
MERTYTGNDASALSVAKSQTLQLKPQCGLYVRCLSGQIHLVQQGIPGEHVLPPGTRYRAASEGLIIIGSVAELSIIAVGRAEGARHPGVGPIGIDSDLALGDGARQLRAATLAALLRRHG